VLPPASVPPPASAPPPFVPAAPAPAAVHVAGPTETSVNTTPPAFAGPVASPADADDELAQGSGSLGWVRRHARAVVAAGAIGAGAIIVTLASGEEAADPGTAAQPPPSAAQAVAPTETASPRPAAPSGAATGAEASAAPSSSAAAAPTATASSGARSGAPPGTKGPSKSGGKKPEYTPGGL
jgi:hypothetical protein